MKHLSIFILIVFLSLTPSKISAQISDNPIDVLTQKLLQNELLSNRFIRNFVFIKTNTFKKKAMADMDKSLAKFDDNLSYIILHLPYDKKTKEDFLKLQNLWSIYRLDVTDYNKEHYKKLILKTRKLEKYINALNKDVLIKHPAYGRNKKNISLAELAVQNGKDIDKIAAAYVLQNGLNFPDAFNYFEINSGDFNKNLKKIGKFKKLAGKTHDLILDLKTNLASIITLKDKGKYNPKMMYAYVNSYSKKTFKLLDIIIKTIN